MKKLLIILSLTLVLCLSFALVACNTDEASKAAKAQSYVSLDINPEISFIVDTEGKVMTVSASNEDGQVLLYGETGIVGSDVDTAIEIVTKLAIDLGYLSEDNKVVDVSVSSNTEVNTQQLQAKVNAKIETVAQNKGLTVKTTMEGAFSLLKELEDFKAENSEDETISNLTVGKYKLMLEVASKGEISLKEAAQLSEAKLIEKVANAHKNCEAYATQAYRQAKIQATLMYDKLVKLAEYAVYTEFFAKNIADYPLQCYYGGAYQMYASTAVGFKIITECANIEKNIRNQELDEASVTAIMEVFGLESSEELKDAEGKITLDSVYAYADIYFKNATQDISLQKENLENAINTTKMKLKTMVDGLDAKFMTELTTLVNNAKAIASPLNTSISAIVKINPSAGNLLSDFETFVADFETIMTAVEGYVAEGSISIEDIEGYILTLEEKADAMLARIEELLTDEELEEIEQMKEEAINKLNNHKQIMLGKIEDAAQLAKNELKGLKENRRTANNKKAENNN